MKKMIVIFMFFACSFGLSHGGDEPGPHGGFIEMPGAFHTEVVPVSDGVFNVYLLDMEFKNPSVKNSEVQAWLRSGKKKTALDCTAQKTYFHCVSADKKLQGKELIIKAKREEMRGNEALYKLPLKK